MAKIALALIMIQAIPAHGASVSYAYDSLSRLTKADYGDGVVINYTYDSAGNRLSQVTTGIAPSIATQPLGQTVVMNQSATLQVSATGSGPLSYQWYLGTSGDVSNPIAGADRATFTTPALATTTSYWARVTNGVGSADSSTAIVAVITPPVIATHPLSTSASLGGTPTLSVSASGLSLDYQWFIGQSGDTSRPISGAISASYTTPPMSDIASYWVRVTNPAGSVDSNTATVDSADTDGDGLTDLQEARITLTDPMRRDTDFDGVSDAFEDADGDGLGNLVEILVYGTNPRMTDSNGDSLSDTYEACLDGTPFAPRVGNQITLDLKRLANAGETIKLVGKLPTGLKFNATTGLLSGLLSGKRGNYVLTIQFLQGKTVVRTVSLPLTILPYPATLLGSFEGLLEDAGGKPTGIVRLSITKPNAWSATMESAGASRRSAKGSFLLDQQTDTVTLTAIFAASKTVPAESVTMTLSADSPLLSGNRAGGTLRGFRIAQGMEIPASGAMCNLALDPGEQDGIAAPAGIGWLSGKFGKTGSATFKGLLGDATTASVSLRMSATGQVLVWAQPYANKQSFLGGIVTLPNLGQSPANNQLLEPGLWWSKAADTKTLSYPSGFGPLPVEALGAAWTPPASAIALGSALGWADGRTANLLIEGAGLRNAEPQVTTMALPTALTLDDKFNLNATAPQGVLMVPWLGKVAKADGKWTGTLTLPGGFAPEALAGKAAASGVLLPGADVSGCGLIKVPVAGPKGSFRTATAILDD